MKLRIAFSTLLLGSSLALPASASPLNDYNLILTRDYNYKGGDVEGAAFIGGDLKASGKSPTFATRAFSGPVGLTVVGDMQARNLNINNGKSVAFGGANKVSSRINLNGGGSLTHDGTLSAIAIGQQLRLESALYAGLAANGGFSNGVLKYAGSDDVAVFNLAASLLFAQNTNLQLDYGSAKTVIINVAGSNVAVAGGVNLSGNGFNKLGAANILWNFSEAETINFNGIGMTGAVLAIDADTRGGASFKGAFAAQSYTGDRGFQQAGFNAQLPQPGDNTAAVTEPSLILMFITGVLGLAALHRRKRQLGQDGVQLRLPGL